MIDVRAAARVLLLSVMSLVPAIPAGAQGVIPGVPGRPTIPDTSTSLGAHARFSKAQINMSPAPNLPLAVALITAGGGPAAFDATMLLGNLTGNGPATQTELAALTKRFGADNVASFATTFKFVITDALAQATSAGIALPAAAAPDPSDPKAVSAALFAAGQMPGGRFDVEYMLDTLVTHIIHVAVMNDIDANPDLGPAADANYHRVLTQVMLDLKKTYAL